ncbi:hypothetical protein AB6A40_006703 [Gnathostoma spinigerum]|uniref:Nucleoporin NUP35 n=1 Tax=Gnathostoma spinigerum TaxID=75299 RepID=A0ABD6EJ47_9BILA
MDFRMFDQRGSDSCTSQSAPGYLFGSVASRRSIVGPTHSQLSPKSNVLSRVMGTEPLNKSVHWSPKLTEINQISPSNSAWSPSSRSSRSAASKRPGPPLCSMRDEMMLPKNDTSVSQNIIDVSSGTMYESGQDSSLDFYNEPGGETDYWVMVYGFPPEEIGSILELFSRHGTIVEHSFAPDGSNWVNLRYSTPVHAKQALSRHLKLYDNRILLGVERPLPEFFNRSSDTRQLSRSLNQSAVFPCSPRGRRSCLMKTSPPTHTTTLNNSENAPPASSRGYNPVKKRRELGTSFFDSPISSLDTSLNKTSRSGMRSLSAACHSSGGQCQVDQAEPHKEEDVGSILGKLWGYMSSG